MATALPSSPDSMPPMVSMSLYRLAQLVRRPGEFMAWAVDRYGDPFLVGGLMGPLVVTGDPEGNRAIFTADPDLFEPFNDDVLAPLLGAGSLILLGGTRHRVERKLLMPSFHGARMRAYGEQIREAALRHAADLPVDRPFRMQDLAQAISLEVIIRAVFGIVEPDRVSRFREAVTGMLAAITPSVVFFEPIRRSFGGVGPWSRFLRAQERLSSLLLKEIEQREVGPRQGEDILSLLLNARYDDQSRMSRESIRDELITLLLAGHETTAISLAWSFYQLHRLEPVRRRLLEELRSLGPEPDPETIARLPWLDAVCNEVLRLYPVIPLVPRRLTAPFTLKGYELPRGMGVAAAISLTHVNPAIYPEPLEFRPERFLERSYSPFEFLPFGGGARRCLGAAFAEFEMKVVLGALLPRYELQLERQAPLRAVRRNLTLGPNTGVRMRVKRRGPPHQSPVL